MKIHHRMDPTNILIGPGTYSLGSTFHKACSWAGNSIWSSPNRNAYSFLSISFSNFRSSILSQTESFFPSGILSQAEHMKEIYCSRSWSRSLDNVWEELGSQ
jgi:hypothetical protein